MNFCIYLHSLAIAVCKHYLEVSVLNYMSHEKIEKIFIFSYNVCLRTILHQRISLQSLA